MRLIDADDLYREMSKQKSFGELTAKSALRSVANAPTIERKKGKWIPVDSFSAFGGDEATWMAHGNPTAFYYCSECKEQAYTGEDGEPLLTDFCPNCGADMRGEQDEGRTNNQR